MSHYEKLRKLRNELLPGRARLEFGCEICRFADDKEFDRSLSELVEACGNMELYVSYRGCVAHKRYFPETTDQDYYEIEVGGKTPIEAVTNLYGSINKK